MTIAGSAGPGSLEPTGLPDVTPAQRMAGKVAIVTGASRGIGLAIAHRLVAEGARVVITARKQEALTVAVEELGGTGLAVAVAGRADDAGHRTAAVQVAVQTFGQVDLLINNTGINPVYGPVSGTDAGAAAKVFDVNVMSALAWRRMTVEQASMYLRSTLVSLHYADIRMIVRQRIKFRRRRQKSPPQSQKVAPS